MDKKDRKEYQRDYQKHRIANETPEEREKRLNIIKEYRKRHAEYFKAYQRQYQQKLRKKRNEEGDLSYMKKNAVSTSKEKKQQKLLAVPFDKVKRTAKINYNGRELQIAQIDVKFEGEDWFSPCECCIYGYRSYYNNCSVKRYTARVFNCQNRQYKEEPCKGGERWVFLSYNNLFNEPQFHLQLDRAYIEAKKKI